MFINKSRRGAKIEHISAMVDDFCTTDNAALDVEKVILSFGTNEVKFETKGVGKFKQPVFDLLKKVKLRFPYAIIYVQATLPVRNIYWCCVDNLLGFNQILGEACIYFNCTFVDCFWDFLSLDYKDYNRNLFWDHHHLNNAGLEILAKWFRSVINFDTSGLSVIRYPCC